MNKKEELNLIRLRNKTRNGIVQVSEVRLSNSQLQNENFGKDIDSLLKSIEIYGLLQPIGVSKLSNSDDRKQYKWEIVWGRKRLYAFEILELENIPAVIFDDTLTKKEKEKLSLAYNPQMNVSVTDDEVWNAIKDIYFKNTSGNITEDALKISDLTGIPIRIVKKNLIEKVKNKNSSPT